MRDSQSFIKQSQVPNVFEGEGVREARLRWQSQKLESLLMGLIARAKKKWSKMLGFWMGVVVGLWIYGSMGLFPTKRPQW